MVEKKISFAGHFAVGEKTTVAQVSVFNAIHSMKEDIAIMVNDIGIEDRLSGHFFGQYHFNQRCFRPACGMSEGRIISKDMIDQKMYEKMGKGVLQFVKSNNLLRQSGLPVNGQMALLVKYNPQVKAHIRDVLVPEMIKERLKIYGIEIESHNIFYESKLRNRASERLKSKKRNGSKSWVKNLQTIGEYDQLRGRTATPTCGAIMLALYDELADRGYTKVLQFYDEQERHAIENGMRLYTRLNESFPDDTRWKMQFESKFF